MFRLTMTTNNQHGKLLRKELMFQTENQARNYIARRQWNLWRVRSYKLEKVA